MYGRRTNPHEKHMGSYELFAWRDAMALANLLESDYDVKEIRRAFEEMSGAEMFEFENKNREILQELIRRTEGQRPAYIRKVGKNVSETVRGLLIAFAVIAQVRVMRVMELRDEYRLALAPGSGNRITCAEMFAFQMAVSDAHNIAWPDEVFDAYGGDGGWDDDNGEEDEDET